MILKRLGLFLLVALASCAPAAADGWQEIKADHFIVYYKTDESYAKTIAREADQYYSRITSDLGYERYGAWDWDDRAKIYIYPNKEEYVQIGGAVEWSAGMADYVKKEIYSFSGQPGFTTGTLPHEITHLIFREFVGGSRAIPLWLDEGIAQWEEPAKRAQAIEYSKVMIANGATFPIRDLMAANGGSFANTAQVSIFYMQAISLVDFMIRSYGNAAFTAFCRELRDSGDVERSLRSAYPITIATMDNLDASWKRYATSDR